MPIAIAHFGIGYAFTLLLLLGITEIEKTHLQTFGLFGGIFAMVPDLWRFTPIPKSVVHDSFLANFFIGHRALDTVVEPAVGSQTMGLVGVAAIVVAVVTLYTVREPDITSPFRVSE